MYLVDTNVLLDLVTDDFNWSEWSLLTRDARRYRRYFPKLTLVAP